VRLKLAFLLFLAACADEPGPAVVDEVPATDAPAGVVVLVTDHGDGNPLALADVQLRRGRERLATAQTKSDGTFDFGAHPAGEYVVRAKYSGGTYVPVAERFVLDGSSGIRIEVVLRAFEGQVVRVAVPDGVALPRVVELLYTKLSTEGSKPIKMNVPLDEEGSTTMRNLPPARYRMRFRVPGCAPVEREIEIDYTGNDPVVIAFERQ